MFNFKKFKNFIPDKGDAKFWVILFAMWAVIVIAVWGWINNIVWVFDQEPLITNGETIVSLIGIVVFPVGMVHGIWLWF